MPGRTAFAHIDLTLPGESLPSRVVRSMERIARSIAARLASRLSDRFEKSAARASSMTASTAGDDANASIGVTFAKLARPDLRGTTARGAALPVRGAGRTSDSGTSPASRPPAATFRTVAPLTEHDRRPGRPPAFSAPGCPIRDKKRSDSSAGRGTRALPRRARSCAPARGYRCDTACRPRDSPSRPRGTR
jgi:hypothetical protein